MIVLVYLLWFLDTCWCGVWSGNVTRCSVYSLIGSGQPDVASFCEKLSLIASSLFCIGKRCHMPSAYCGWAGWVFDFTNASLDSKHYAWRVKLWRHGRRSCPFALSSDAGDDCSSMPCIGSLQALFAQEQTVGLLFGGLQLNIATAWRHMMMTLICERRCTGDFLLSSSVHHHARQVGNTKECHPIPAEKDSSTNAALVAASHSTL